ncbi:hypothetical protein [Sphingomonas sp. R86521]|uniref:hypothetical protein n=1 Tax=Sphingomonas sp. R86521 TaxID=3093860 RepID=UPI0036D233F2
MFDPAVFAQAGTVDPAQIMQGLADEDPRVAMMMKLMQSQQAPSTEDKPDERDDLIADLSERLDAAETRLVKMTRVARQLHDANAVAMGRLGRLAAALGACGLCWGDDDLCPGCRGRGGVGMVRPDPVARAALIGRREPPTRQHAATGH